MSATRRGVRLGGPEDFYATPSYCVDRLLEATNFPGGHWLEPSAGNGAIIKAVNQKRRDVLWTALEIRAEEYGKLKEVAVNPQIGDFLNDGVRMPTVWTSSQWTSPRVVIGNPPYNLAMEFIERALLLYPRADIAFLLRLNFAGSIKRAKFLRKYPPDIYVLPNRPSFCNGKTDATEYAWFVWPYEKNRTCGSFQVLATTEKE